jgi:pimeloyl-ACP methyl ester carboxylesterase
MNAISSISTILRAAGHELYTPTLTVLGASSHLLHGLNRISLVTHAKNITNMLFYEDLSEVVLVGHSYGGMVITGVAAKQPHRLAQLVYLDVYLPLEVENEIVLWQRISRKSISPMLLQASSSVRPYHRLCLE